MSKSKFLITHLGGGFSFFLFSNGWFNHQPAKFLTPQLFFSFAGEAGEAVVRWHPRGIYRSCTYHWKTSTKSLALRFIKVERYVLVLKKTWDFQRLVGNFRGNLQRPTRRGHPNRYSLVRESNPTQNNLNSGGGFIRSGQNFDRWRFFVSPF